MGASTTSGAVTKIAPAGLSCAAEFTVEELRSGREESFRGIFFWKNSIVQIIRIYSRGVAQFKLAIMITMWTIKSKKY